MATTAPAPPSPRTPRAPKPPVPPARRATVAAVRASGPRRSSRKPVRSAASAAGRTYLAGGGTPEAGGAALGSYHRARKAKKAARAPHGIQPGSRNRLLMAEFLLCFSVLALGTIVPTPTGRPQEGVPHLMTKGSGLALLFFILALVSGTGQRSRSAAAGLGALVTVAYVVTSTDAYNIMSWVGQFYSAPGSPGAGVPTAAARGTDYVTAPAAPYPWQTATTPPPAAGPPSGAEWTA